MGLLKKAKTQFFAQFPFFMAVPALLWQFLFFYIPLCFIIWFSFLKNPDIAGAGFSLQHYADLAQSLYVIIILKSFALAFCTAVLCLLFGYPVAYYIGIKKRSWKTLFLSFLILPFWTNLLVHVYAWYFILDRDGLLNAALLKLGIISHPLVILNTVPAIILVMFYCYLPFMILPLLSTLEKFNLDLIEASRDLGANQWQTFYKIVLPLSYPGIQTGFLLVFVPSFAEFVIPLLMGGDKNMYVGGLISFYFLIIRNWARGAAFTVVSSIILILMCISLVTYFKKRVQPHKRKI